MHAGRRNQTPTTVVLRLPFPPYCPICNRRLPSLNMYVCHGVATCGSMECRARPYGRRICEKLDPDAFPGLMFHKYGICWYCPPSDKTNAITRMATMARDQHVVNASHQLPLFTGTRTRYEGELHRTTP